jgi:hypothetical protein
MTTIAWDGKTLAADRRLVVGNKCYRAGKLYRFLDGSVAGFAGHAGQITQVVEWLANGEDPESAPEVDDVRGIIASTSALLFVENTTLIPVDRDQPVSVGSGEDYALVILRDGGSAEQAVLRAAEFDPFTGDGVETLEPSEPIDLETEPEDTTVH